MGESKVMLDGKLVSEEEKKKYCFLILKAVAEFCDKNNIRYYLAYGTLIGAIRHKGFIPWDDDIDIIIPRQDYIRFINLWLCKDESVFPHYKLISPYSNPKSLYKRLKVADNRTILYEQNQSKPGIFLDIFPSDGFKSMDTWKTDKKLVNLLTNAYVLLYSRFTEGGGVIKEMLRYLFLLLSSFFDNTKILKKIDEILQSKFNFDGSPLVACTDAGYGNKELCRREWFDNRIKVEFEGDMFFAPSGYHEFLTQIYADYMTLPPIDKRVSHSYEMFWMRNV